MLLAVFLGGLIISQEAALAQEMPMPTMFRGMQGQKGQWEVEVLEGGGRAGKMPPKMTLCTDNLMGQSGSTGKPRAEPGCKHRLVKDTPDEAVMETVCKERTSTITMKREGEKSLLMSMSSTGPRGPQEMKMRYTHLGPCKEGQGAMRLDKDSEQCRRLKEQQAKMDPATACDRAGNRQQCEEQMRNGIARLKEMCG